MFWKRLRRWLMELFGIDVKAVTLGDKVFMPLFYVTQTGGTAATWDYLNKSKDDQKYCRDMILNMCKSGETPAICFLLTPGYEAGSVFDHFPKINEYNLSHAIDAMRECAWDGIAVVPCLYTDDKPANPVTHKGWFYEIESYEKEWGYIHERIKRYVSAYCLSIESNEQCKTVSALQHYIYLMGKFMPGKPCGVHLQWQSRGSGNYVWNSLASTPENADFILVEFSWHPDNGDSKDVSGLQSEMLIIQTELKDKKLLFHEFNMNPAGEIMPEQRERMRSYRPWGVG